MATHRRCNLIIAFWLVLACSAFSQNFRGTTFTGTVGITGAVIRVIGGATWDWGNTVVVDGLHGNDATGARTNGAKPFKTITAAKAVAVAGDIILVRAGVYNENNLIKGGVNYWGDPNAHIRYVPDGIGATDSYAVFDDRDAATTNTISGFGDISFYGYDIVGDAKGAFHLEQANSIVNLQCNRVLFSQHIGTAEQGAVDVRNCKWFSVTCNEITDSAFLAGQVAGVYWEKGDGYIKCPRIIMDEGPAIYCAQAAASGIQTNTFKVDVDYIQTAQTIFAPYHPVTITTTNPNCRIVLKGKYWATSSGNTELYRQDGNATVSVNVDYTESAGDAYIVTGGTLELGGRNIFAQRYALQAAGGRTVSTVSTYSHLSGVTGSAELISLIGGTNTLRNGLVYRTNGPGIKVSGSQSTRLVGMTVQTINTSGAGNTNSPLEVLTNGVILQNVRLVAPAGVDSVKSTNVINPISVEGVLSLSTAPSPTTVLQGGRTEVDALWHTYFSSASVRSSSVVYPISGAGTYVVITNYADARLTNGFRSDDFGTFTNLVAGYYMLHGSVTLVASNQPRGISLDIHTNGTSARLRQDVTATNNFQHLSTSGLRFLPANCAVTMRISDINGSNNITNNHSHFTIVQQ